MWSSAFLEFQCVFLLFFAMIISFSETGADEEYFVDLLSPAPGDPLTWKTTIKIKSLCATEKIVGVTIFVKTPRDNSPNGRKFQKVWRCRGNEDFDTPKVRIRRVRIPLADDIAFRPSVFNKNATVVSSSKILVWMLDSVLWSRINKKGKRNIHNYAFRRKVFEVYILPPYSRPYKSFDQRCVPWFWNILQSRTFSDRFVCPPEQMNVTLVDFPVVLNGGVYGFYRSLSPFHEQSLEIHRRETFLSPRFSLEVWVYVVEYCPLPQLNMANACLIVAHMTKQDTHLTPVILVDNSGRLQIEVAGPDMYVARKTQESIPKYQWVRILFTIDDRTWSLEWSYGENHTIVQKTQDKFDSAIYFDESEGIFLLGGADARLGSFQGYLGHATLYRGQVLVIEQLTLPQMTHAMFAVDIRRKDRDCRPFLQWIQEWVGFYVNKASRYRNKNFCQHSYHRMHFPHQLNSELPKCPKRPQNLTAEREDVAKLLKSQAISKGRFSKTEGLFVARKLLQIFTSAIEDRGFENLHLHIPFLEQSACLGNTDALFILATLLNNGVGTDVNESRSVTMLMDGALSRHRLSLLSLGHRHTMGIDGIPVDTDIAYMYYKDVGDSVKEDRELHPEDQVATESVRLLDEKSLEQQTDETGDLYLWLKHQARQGVASAQTHLAHLYFWGSQGMRRNLHAARNLFEEGAQRGDIDSVYNLGLMDLLGRGGAEKNETLARQRLKEAAEKAHPFAISALGWIALEKDKNLTLAAQLFEQAFRLHFADAGYYLGHMHQFGLYPNASKNHDTALYYYEWAAIHGHVTAALLFAQFQSKGTQKVPRNSYVALQWARFVAEQNSVIGKMLREGVTAYREGNLALSAYYYLLASESGPEIASFNLAWLCQEYTESVTTYMNKDCCFRHYNLTVQREQQFVDSYSYMKMGDHYWYGDPSQRNVTKAAEFYASAARKPEPHALFNLGLMVEQNADIPHTVWRSLGMSPAQYLNNLTLLVDIYERCRDSPKTEAFIPCSMALYRIQLLHLWSRYQYYVQSSGYVGGFISLAVFLYFLILWTRRINDPPMNLF